MISNYDLPSSDDADMNFGRPTFTASGNEKKKAPLLLHHMNTNNIVTSKLGIFNQKLKSLNKNN